jgi:RNA polymerase sigma factor for flagellar operon FliA
MEGTMTFYGQNQCTAANTTNAKVVEFYEDEKERIIKDFLPKIRCLAQRLSFKLPPELSTEDLVSAGIIGLMEAIDRFDPEKETKLKTYAEFRIRGAMIDEIRSMQWASRDVKRKIGEIRKGFEELEMKLQRSPEEEEVAQHLGITLDEYYDIVRSANGAYLIGIEDICSKVEDGHMDFLECLADQKSPDPLSLLGLQETKLALSKGIDELPVKERMVLTLYYYEEMTMKEVGAVLGLSESRVCQIHSQSVSKLKKKLNKKK